jgi:transaldolase
MNQLDQLKTFTIVVADSSDFESIKQYKPTDATTNPSLIYAASQKKEYEHLVDEAISFAKKSNSKNQLELALDKLSVNFAMEILKIVPNRVSIEVDARHSFDTKKSIQKAKELISLLEANGIDRSRILIKLATTWEGIRAAKELEKEKIHCNLTLLFSLPQAVACALANVTLISPFVGRILDWHVKNTDKKSFLPSEDPGVISVKAIFDYYKKFNYKTQIMGASFRNKSQILELSGCDLLTISPNLLEELKQESTTLHKKLQVENSYGLKIEKMKMDEKAFRYLLNQNAMASEKLSEGIRKFVEDIEKLEKLISLKLGS